jgi:hypothetical protein
MRRFSDFLMEDVMTFNRFYAEKIPDILVISACLSSRSFLVRTRKEPKETAVREKPIPHSQVPFRGLPNSLRSDMRQPFSGIKTARSGLFQ